MAKTASKEECREWIDALEGYSGFAGVEKTELVAFLLAVERRLPRQATIDKHAGRRKVGPGGQSPRSSGIGASAGKGGRRS
jgi:hypothetical protein